MVDDGSWAPPSTSGAGGEASFAPLLLLIPLHLQHAPAITLQLLRPYL